MNPEQYHRRHEPGLPSDFQYDGSFTSSLEPNYHLQSFDSLPRSEQQQLNPWPSSFHNYSFASHMPVSGLVGWNSATTQLPLDEGSSYYDYSATGPGSHPDSSIPLVSQTPRLCVNLAYNGRVVRVVNENSMAFKSYGTSDYVMEPTAEMSNHGPMYDNPNSSRDFSRLSLSGSPKLENDSIEPIQVPYHDSVPPGMHHSEASDDVGPYSREMTAVEVEDPSTDEPYAKLIWRALMSAPDHSMVLQEIYQWFRENTTKGSSDTKGWMNSIRHNLSMNAAFKKTERKVSGDDTKKSTEWVLEEFAIKDGVQSTTRYRKGTGTKKFVKSDTAAPARQIAGQRGGNAVKLYKRPRGRDDRFDARDHRDHRRSHPTVDTGARSQFHDPLGPSTTQRHISPLTPNPESIQSSSPYYRLKNEDMDLGVRVEDNIPLYTYEDVQGVWNNNSPPFINDNDSLIHNSHPVYTHHY